MDIEIKIYSKLNTELKEYWNKLEKDSYSYCFQSYDWYKNWVNHFRENNNKYSLCIIVVFSKSEILSIFPFEIEKKFNLNILKWSGGDQADYCAPIINKNFNIDKDSFISLWKKILLSIPKIDLVYFNKQPENIENFKNPFVSYLNTHRDSNTYNILLPKTWKDYTNINLKKNFLLQNLRKKKQLKKLGNVKFIIAKSKEEKEKFIKELIIQKKERLSSLGLKDIFKDKNLKFYMEFENENIKKIDTHICSLVFNNELIAIHWGVIYKDRFYYLLLSMKEGKLDRYSPGRLLISLLIRWSITKKIKVFDFTLGDENYKKSWSNNIDGLFNFIKLNSLRGFLLFFLIKTKLILKSLDKENYLRKTIFFIRNFFKMK